MGLHDYTSKYTHFLRWVFGLSCMMVTMVALIPVEALPATELPVSRGDKVLHALAFAILCLIGSFAYCKRSYSLALGLLIFGGAIEIAQYALGWRHMESLDFLADAVGISVGRGIYHMIRRRNLSIR